MARELRAAARAKRASSRTSGRSARIPRAPGARRSARLARRPSGRSLGSLVMSFPKKQKTVEEYKSSPVRSCPSGRSARSSDILGRVHLLSSSEPSCFCCAPIFARERSSGNSARTPRGLARHITAVRSASKPRGSSCWGSAGVRMEKYQAKSAKSARAPPSRCAVNELCLLCARPY